MIITIKKVSRDLREGISKKTGKQYSFESLGIAPAEDKLTDINGDEFDRNSRWINGFSKKGVTDDWAEGDKVKILLLRRKVPGRDGVEKEVINFSLPEGVEPMVQKASTEAPAPDKDDVDPTDW